MDVDLSTLENPWYCSMNRWDSSKNSCNAREDRYDDKGYYDDKLRFRWLKVGRSSASRFRPFVDSEEAIQEMLAGSEVPDLELMYAIQVAKLIHAEDMETLSDAAAMHAILDIEDKKDAERKERWKN